MDALSQWLQQLGLERYAGVLAENDVDFEAVRLLSDSDLAELGVSLGHRRKLLNAIAHLNAGAVATDTALAASSGEPAGVAGEDRALKDGTAESGERRQLTVLFCDMVGFTELASRVDPEILQKIIRVYEDTCAAAITRFDGYVFQRLGDGIVAFFGYPLAHEGEAERAIRAGLDIIDAFSDLDVAEVGHLQVRIGIAAGLVVVASAEKGAVGETMNLASRLQGIAQVDTIVVSERVRRLAGGSFEYLDLGKQTLKGIARSTHAYGIVGVSDAASRFDAASGMELTPLVGRDLELGLLMDRWALAQEGEGQVVLLSGEPGIGKSRILSALREKLEAEGATAMRFQCSPYYNNSAFWPSIDNFERALKFERDEPPESKLDKLEALMVEHYGRPQSDVRFIASMLSIPCEERYGEITMTPQKFKDETLRTLVDLTEAAATKQPSVMLYEDVHWADPTTLEVADLLIDRVKAIPLLIVLTHRPEFQNRWADHGHVTGLNLSKITRAQSTAMVTRVAHGKALPADLLEQILVKTDGVPLFVEELTKSILESGELTEAGDRYDYAGTSHTVTIPATLRDSLMARLDRFMPVKEIAQIGAAIGRDFSYELIAAVSPISQAQLNDALAQLTDSGLAFRRGTPPEANYTFKHALVQDAAYDSLLKSRRQALHGKIANAVEERFPNIKDTEPEVLASHLNAAGQTGAAIPLWKKAGELASKRVALVEAISHLNKGLELIDTLPASVERDSAELAVRIPLGVAWITFKGWPTQEVWSSLHPALALAKSLRRNDALVPILLGLWSNLNSQGRHGESLAWVDEMLDTGKMTGDAGLLIMGHVAACIRHYWMGSFNESNAHGDEVLALYDEEKHRHLVGALNSHPKAGIGIYRAFSTWALGYPDRAVQAFDDAVAPARRLGHPFDLGFVLAEGADVFNFRGEPEKQRKLLDESDHLARENSLPALWTMVIRVRYGTTAIREGNAAEGIALLKAGLAVWEEIGGKNDTPRLKSELAEGMAMVGDVDGALQIIDESIDQAEHPDCDEREHYAEILRLKGWMLTLKDNPEGAEKNYIASLDVSREQKAKSWELRTSTSLARLWQQQGKTTEAHDLLSPIYNWFTEGFNTKDLKEAKALLEELAA